MTSRAVREPLPRFVEPMLLRPGLPEDHHEEWAIEVKWDGLRAQLQTRRDGTWSMRTRPGGDRSTRFPELAGVAAHLRGHDVVIDGELVCLASDGKPDFAAVRRRLIGSRKRPVAVTLIAFDLLHLDGWSLRGLPYLQRREQLLELLGDGPGVRVPEHWIGEIDAISAITRDHGLEGVVCKRLDSPYRSTRSNAWLKHKHRRRERLAVTGWRPGEGEPDTGTSRGRTTTGAFGTPAPRSSVWTRQDARGCAKRSPRTNCPPRAGRGSARSPRESASRSTRTGARMGCSATRSCATSLSRTPPPRTSAACRGRPRRRGRAGRRRARSPRGR